MPKAFFAWLFANVTMAFSALMRFILPKIENKYKRGIGGKGSRLSAALKKPLWGWWAVSNRPKRIKVVKKRGNALFWG
jgi:hypothetical protein